MGLGVSKWGAEMTEPGPSTCPSTRAMSSEIRVVGGFWVIIRIHGLGCIGSKVEGLG